MIYDEAVALILILLPAIALIVPIVITLIVVIGRVIRERVSGISQKSFEKLAKELKEENAGLKAELIVVREYLASINTLLREVE